MTLSSSFALFVAMIVLAVLPGPGILVVVARSLQGGFRQGAITSLGIVAGDYVYIVLSVFGLVALANAMGNFFVWVQYLGAAYLMFLAVQIAVAPSSKERYKPLASRASSFANFMAGLLTTLSNPKAILFYLSFLPAFLDLTSVSVFDLIVVLAIALVSVGGVMLGYAYLAVKTQSLSKSTSSQTWIRRLSASLLVLSAIFVALRGA